MRRIKQAVIGLVVFWGFLSASAQATVILPLGIDQLLDHAAMIFVGEVKTITPAVGGDGQPIENITFTVLRAIKGVQGPELTVAMAAVDSTQDGPVVTRPRLKLGQKSLFFLGKPQASGLVAPVGLSQGVFRLQVQPASGREFWVNGMNNLGLKRSLKTTTTRAAALGRTWPEADRKLGLPRDEFLDYLAEQVTVE